MDWLVMVIHACMYMHISILLSVGRGWKTGECLRLAWPTYGDPVFLSPKQGGHLEMLLSGRGLCIACSLQS